jgi:DNA-binding transcriptional regulator GbsR (MarR family)
MPENAQMGLYRHTDAPMKYIEGDYLDTARSNSQNTSRRVSTAPSNSSGGLSLPRINSAGMPEETQKKPLLIPSLDLTQKPSRRNPSNANPIPLPKHNNQYKANEPPKALDTNQFASFPEENESNEENHKTTASNPLMYKDTPFTSSLHYDPESFMEQAAQLNSTNSKSVDVEPNSELRSLLDTIAGKNLTVNKDEFRKKAKERVIAQAFNRCLDDIDGTAQVEDFRKYEERKLYENWQQEEMKKKEKQQKLSKDLKKALDSQLDYSITKKANELFDQKHTVSKYILPDYSGQIATDLVDGVPVDRRKVIARDLKKRIQENEDSLKRAKEETMKKEREQMNNLVLETEIQSIVHRMDHLSKQRDLLEAWEQDGHIRNLKKLQSRGKEFVTDYVDRNLVELNASMNTFSPSMNQSLNMSIGFDSRKGKF